MILVLAIITFIDWLFFKYYFFQWVSFCCQHYNCYGIRMSRILFEIIIIISLFAFFVFLSVDLFLPFIYLLIKLYITFKLVLYPTYHFMQSLLWNLGWDGTFFHKENGMVWNELKAHCFKLDRDRNFSFLIIQYL